MKYFIVLPVIFLLAGGFLHKGANTVSEKPVCPVCRTDKNSVGVVYGKPTRETMERAKKGEFVLGGCMVGKDSPKHFCKKDSTYY